MAQQAGAYLWFSSMKRLGVFLLLPGWNASPLQVFSYIIKFTSTHFYNWVEKGTVGAKRLAQEDNTMSLPRAPDS